jgi:hypothetical protein
VIAEVIVRRLCAITTRGFPTAIAALGWIDEVIGDATTEQE